MPMLKNKRLRLQITALVGMILFVMMILLTGISILNANSSIDNTVELISSAPLHLETVTVPGAVEGQDNLTLIPIGSEINIVRSDFLYKSIFFMIIIVVFGIILTYIVMNQALRPIKILNDTIKEINAHNLSVRLSGFEPNDEIGELAASFNIMLERLDKAFAKQKNFAAGAAHELQTPLTTMKASLQVLGLEKDPSVADYASQANIMAQSTERLIALVGNLLSLTSDGQLELSDEIKLSELFRDVAEELSTLAARNNIAIKLDSNDAVIYGNVTLLRRALFNLVENAIKYGKWGGTVELYCKCASTNIEVHVRDDGYGIPIEHVDNIFEPFYRVDKSRSRHAGGAGLGLSIVKSIVEKHQGRITVASRVDQGTEFVIFLSQHKVMR